MSWNRDVTRLLFVVVMSTSLSYAQEISGLLPDSIGGMTKSDPARIYAGDELYRLIDGGADIFKEYGFDRVAVQRYSDSVDNYIDVELYEMNDSSSAYGVFSMVTYTTGEKIEDFPCEAYAGEGFILIWKGKYYASLTASGPSGERELAGAARKISRAIPSAGTPPLIALLTPAAANSNPGFKLAYIKGSLALFNLSRMEFGRNFRVGYGVFLSSPVATGIVIAYDTDDDAIDNRGLLEEHLMEEARSESVYRNRDSSMCRLGGKYLKSLRAGKHLILLMSEDRVELERVSNEIESVLRAG